MIFLTLGTQLPFERLVQALDEAAESIDEPVFGQIGKTTYAPKNFETVDFLTPSEFSQKFAEARVIVGHAGIGTILSGVRAEKPLALMARQAKHGEHRNDHQLATVSQVKKIAGVHIVEDANELAELLRSPQIEAMKNTVSPARAKLVGSLRQEIFGPEMDAGNG